MDPVICACCNCETRATFEAPGGETRCESCFYDEYTTCEDCGDTLACDDANYSANSECYCDACYSEHYCRCESCRCEVRRNDAITSECGDDYCHDCYSENFGVCDECGCECSRENLIYSERQGCEYCESCYPRDDEDICARRFAFNLDDTCKLLGSLRTFGLELETSECDGFSSLDCETYFESKDDGSIDGKEFVSLVLRGDRGLDAISEFCRAARNFSVDAKCGFHLHIGVSDLDDEQLCAVCAAYYYFAQVWRSFVADTRRNNRYCSPLQWGVEDLAAKCSFRDFADNQDRYQWLNVSAYVVHQTLEVRLHSGTLDPDKIRNWTRAHIRFVDYFSRYTLSEVRGMLRSKTPQALFALLCQIWRDEDLAQFYASRAEKFGTYYYQPEYA